MNRRTFLSSLSATLPFAAMPHTLLGASSSVAAPPLTVPAGDMSRPLMTRYTLTRDRVLHGTGPAYTPDFLLEDIVATGNRRFTNFSGDVSGRWVGALASASRTYGEAFPVLDEVVTRIIALQKPDGYFGKVFRYVNQDDDDMALLWGNGRLLVGLMEYYKLKPKPEVLTAARKLGDFLVRIGPDFNTQKKADEFGAAHYGSSYICWTQQTEGLAALYGATKDERYNQLAIDISKRIERRAGDHVHGYLCSLRGIVDLYAITGNEALLSKAKAEWASVTGSGELLTTGGVPERWTPKRERTEGCAECDWLRLGLSLHRATGDPMYLEAAERTLFNEFSMNQMATGDFGHGELDANGTPVMVRTRAWWCCTLHGMRAFSDVSDNVFRVKGSDVFYDLPEDAECRTDGFVAHSTSTLATNGSIQIRIVKASAQSLTIRKPSWAGAVTLTRNGSKVAGLRIENVKAGDVIAANFVMSLRQEPVAHMDVARNTFSFGPWLLGVRADNGNAGYYGEHIPDNRLVQGTTASAKEKVTTPFDVPVAATNVTYVSAEFAVQPGTVQMRAVAEQTGTLPMMWETAFVLVPGKRNSAG